MPRYLVKRSFTDGLHIPMGPMGAKTCAEVAGTDLDTVSPGPTSM